MENRELLEIVIGGWRQVRQNVLNEVKNLPADRFDFRPHPEARSIAEVCRHIAQSAVAFAKECVREDGSLARLPLPTLYQEHTSHLPRPGDQEGIIALLESTWDEAEKTLRHAGPESLEQRMGTLSGEMVPRLRVLMFAVNHEFYHCGQLTGFARAMGATPAMTQRFASMGFTGVPA